MKQSAKGAEYESQGQARSEAERVALGCNKPEEIRPERPKYHGYYALFRATEHLILLSRGDALRFASCLPLAFIFRAVGARFRFLRQSNLMRCRSTFHLRNLRSGFPFATRSPNSMLKRCYFK